MAGNTLSTLMQQHCWSAVCTELSLGIVGDLSAGHEHLVEHAAGIPIRADNGQA